MKRERETRYAWVSPCGRFASRMMKVDFWPLVGLSEVQPPSPLFPTMATCHSLSLWNFHDPGRIGHPKWSLSPSIPPQIYIMSPLYLGHQGFQLIPSPRHRRNPRDASSPRYSLSIGFPRSLHFRVLVQ